MNTRYMTKLQVLKRECDRELDRAQVNEPPSRDLLQAMRGVIEERVVMELTSEGDG